MRKNRRSANTGGKRFTLEEGLHALRAECGKSIFSKLMFGIDLDTLVSLLLKQGLLGGGAAQKPLQLIPEGISLVYLGFEKSSSDSAAHIDMQIPQIPETIAVNKPTPTEYDMISDRVPVASNKVRNHRKENEPLTHLDDVVSSLVPHGFSALIPNISASISLSKSQKSRRRRKNNDSVIVGPLNLVNGQHVERTLNFPIDQVFDMSVMANTLSPSANCHGAT